MPSTNAAASLKTASVLAFERKLDPSDAVFSAGPWAERESLGAFKPITVREKSVRGTISNRFKAKDQDPAKLDSKIENPNPQTVDVATLPSDADTLRVEFSLRVLGGAGYPSACNNSAYQTRLGEVIDEYVHKHRFTEIARRYAFNLANGRFLWRNRVGAEEVDVRVARLSKGQRADEWRFNALDHSLRDFPSQSTESIGALGSAIDRGLMNEEHALFRVIAFVRMGNGQEVFPSQELILDKDSKKSRTLYAVDGTAGMHSQKIGNALRTIDTWHSEIESLGPIAIEPYGSVTTLGRACRQPRAKIDFYSLLDNWIVGGTAPDVNQQHYVIAMLIRGGVFGKSDK